MLHVTIKTEYKGVWMQGICTSFLCYGELSVGTAPQISEMFFTGGNDNEAGKL